MNVDFKTASPGMVYATGEQPIFKPGDAIRIRERKPVGHYRVPTYLRGKKGVVELVIEPTAVDNEEEGFGRNAGSRRHYYRIALQMTEIAVGAENGDAGFRDDHHRYGDERE